jgi:hypothetical protein
VEPRAGVDDVERRKIIEPYLQDGRLHNLYSSPNFAWLIKSKKMKWSGHEAEKCMQHFDKEIRREENTWEI